MSAKSYYLKYDVDKGQIILDVSKEKTHGTEYFVNQHKITKQQGLLLRNSVKHQAESLGRNLFVNEIEFLFGKLFHVCKTCGFVTNRDKVNRWWGKECEKCFRITQKVTRAKNDADKFYRRQIRKMKLHLNTLQGQIDAVPIEVIEANLKIELKRKGKRMSDITKVMMINNSTASTMFKQNLTIRKEYLLAACEYLYIPLKKLLKLPRGYTVEYKDGVPKFWLDRKYTIRTYDETISGKKFY